MSNKTTPRAPSAPRYISPSGNIAASHSPIATIGNWLIEGHTNSGTLTDLYLARPTGCPPDWPSDYVLKVLKAPYDSDELALGTLHREAEVGGNVTEQHIVPILECGLIKPPYYLVMPRLNGASVNKAIAAIGRISVPQALWIARQTAMALKGLHKQGWIHADVKPSNIVVSPEGHATLIDFGCALRPDEPMLSWDRPVVGTLHYIAPEMFTSTSATDCRSDIYSLGVSLFEMLSGELPFAYGDQSRLIQAHLHEQPADLRQLHSHIPSNVAELVAMMLAKDPLKRPQTARELIDRLTDLEIETLDIRVAA
ncbi:MAG: serine/threonine protein kinase [Planctomycetales bacterium]|nr:serine/threonine protein kinase [Planctomycetales bacterium]